MLVLAAIDWAQALPTVIGVCGLSGIIFTALRYRRDDTTAVLNQQEVIFNDMKTINAELRTTTVSLKQERDTLAAEVERLHVELREASNHPSQVTELHKKLDNGGN